MNWIDSLIIVILVLFTLEGVGRNFVLEFVDFMSFLLAFVLSLRFYDIPASIFEKSFQVSHSLATVLGFATVWFLIEVVFFLFVHVLILKFKIFHQKLAVLNKLAVIPSFCRGLIFVAILLILIGTFPIQPVIKQSVYKSMLGSAILSKTQQLENPLKNIFGGLSQDTLSFLTVKPKSNESVNLGFKTAEFKVDQKQEMKMIELVNYERGSRNLNVLVFDEKLTEIAREHSADMFRRGYFSHYTPEGKNVANRAEGRGISYLVIGENLAYAPSLDLAHNGLMNSPGHRANILAPEFKKIGIGIMDGGVYGLMITQAFSDQI